MILASIEEAKRRGASTDEILAQILKQNPQKAQVFQQAQQRGASADSVLKEIEVQNYLKGLGNFESGGSYTVPGVVVTKGMYKGDRAYGKYQVMGKNIPVWTKEHLGRAYTIDEYLKDPQAQDKLARTIAEKEYATYGNWADVASKWFTGRSYSDAGNATDDLGTNVPTYVKNVVGYIPPKPKDNSAYGKISDVMGNFSEGFAKSGLEHLQNFGNMLAKPIASLIDKATLKPGQTPQPVGFQPDTLKREGLAQNVGAGVETFAEFLLPASKAAKAEGVVNILSHGIKSPFLAATARVAGKSLVQGATAGGVNLLQTGGDLKEAGKTALTAGIARGVFATIGEGARALKIPERLYSMVFKNTKNDMLSEMNSNALLAMQRDDPEKFASLVKAGIVKTGAGGAPLLNDTLAEKALDRGLRGSIKNMASQVINTKFDSELNLQNILKNYTGTVKIPEKQYQNVLLEIAKEYKNVGFGEVSDEASRLASILKSTKGDVPALEALSIRRLLDRLRVSASYDKPATSMSLTQANFKTLSDALRPRINAIPGVQKIMDNYSFSIEALEALAQEAKRRGNSQVISLIDSIFLGGSVVAPIPGLTLGVLRRFLMSGAGSTNIGSALANPNLGVGGSALLQSASAANPVGRDQ